MAEYRIVSEFEGYALFKGSSKVADLYGLYADCKTIAQQLNRAAAIDSKSPDLLEVCRKARAALKVFSFTIIRNDIDLGPELSAAMRVFEGIGAQLDAVIAAAEE